MKKIYVFVICCSLISIASARTFKKELLFDKYTLEDTYKYKETQREVQWNQIGEKLDFIDSIQKNVNIWCTVQNYKNQNGEAPLVKSYKRNDYNRVADDYGVERYQSVPLYSADDQKTPMRYARDGSLLKFKEDGADFVKVEALLFKGEWLVPKKYVHKIDTVDYKKAIIVDRTNQNIVSMERVGKEWVVRSINPATTGLKRPPHMQQTPLGLFIIQQKKPKMIYLKDGSQETGGFAPHASRFTNGGYIHGVPVNAPRTQLIEYSPTLGTTPRSHMCVRNATSHAKYIYDWSEIDKTLVFIIE